LPLHSGQMAAFTSFITASLRYRPKARAHCMRLPLCRKYSDGPWGCQMFVFYMRFPCFSTLFPLTPRTAFGIFSDCNKYYLYFQMDQGFSARIVNPFGGSLANGFYASGKVLPF
jgi:hypothetical protein